MLLDHLDGFVATRRGVEAWLDIPAYDAGVVPYPQRMREYGAKNKKR